MEEDTPKKKYLVVSVVPKTVADNQPPQMIRAQLVPVQKNKKLESVEKSGIIKCLTRLLKKLSISHSRKNANLLQGGGKGQKNPATDEPQQRKKVKKDVVSPPVATPPGLVNNNTNTCYVNSVVQVLLHLEVFITHLNSLVNPDRCNDYDCVVCALCLTCEAVLNNLSNSPSRLLVLVNFIMDFNFPDPEDAIGEHQDAQEFLVNLLGKADINCQIDNNNPHRLQKDDSFLSQVFRFYHEQIITANCGCTTTGILNEISVQINFPPAKTAFNNVQGELDRYFLHDGIYDYECRYHPNLHRTPKKPSIITAQVRRKLISAPSILWLTFSRFNQDGTKNHREVSLPERLSLVNAASTQLLDAGENLYYELNSIIVHIGEVVGDGHYVTYAKNKADGRFYCFNDAIVSVKTDAEVQNNYPYAAFYTKSTDNSSSQGKIKQPILAKPSKHTELAGNDNKRYGTRLTTGTIIRKKHSKNLEEPEKQVAVVAPGKNKRNQDKVQGNQISKNEQQRQGENQSKSVISTNKTNHADSSAKEERHRTRLTTGTITKKPYSKQKKDSDSEDNDVESDEDNGRNTSGKRLRKKRENGKKHKSDPVQQKHGDAKKGGRPKKGSLTEEEAKVALDKFRERKRKNQQDFRDRRKSDPVKYAQYLENERERDKTRYRANREEEKERKRKRYRANLENERERNKTRYKTTREDKVALEKYRKRKRKNQQDIRDQRKSDPVKYSKFLEKEKERKRKSYRANLEKEKERQRKKYQYKAYKSRMAVYKSCLQAPSAEERKRVAEITTEGHLCPNWWNARRGQITGSMVGPIVSLTERGNPNRLISKMLQKSGSGPRTKAMQRGIDLEPTAAKRYREAMKIGEQDFKYPVGFQKHPTRGMFGSTPDAFIKDNGVLEIKCPISSVKELGKKGTYLKPCASSIGGKYIYKNTKPKDRGNYMLNRNHNYFGQVVSEIICSERDYCDFTIYFQNDDDDEEFEIWVERIYKEEAEDYWTTNEPKMLEFWHKYMTTKDHIPMHYKKKMHKQTDIRDYGTVNLRSKDTSKAKQQRQKDVEKNDEGGLSDFAPSAVESDFDLEEIDEELSDYVPDSAVESDYDLENTEEELPEYETDLEEEQLDFDSDISWETDFESQRTYPTNSDVDSEHDLEENTFDYHSDLSLGSDFETELNFSDY